MNLVVSINCRVWKLDLRTVGYLCCGQAQDLPLLLFSMSGHNA